MEYLVPVIALSIVPIGMTVFSKTRHYAFAAWVVAFVALAWLKPDMFLNWSASTTSKAYVPALIQLAMLGMGATLTVQDFLRIARMPRPILLGSLFQFTVMPLTGWVLATLFQLPTEVAAGVILVGSCPGGVSSNVITFLAKGNVALSVTMTAFSTLLAPILTPLMMSLLAGRLVPVPFFAMMQQILWIVLLPVAVGLLISQLAERRSWNRKGLERALSIVSMVSICVICAIIVAESHSALQSVGLTLLIVVACHNCIGYLLGYYGASLAGMDEQICRTIAIEVGLQNGGLGATLATSVLKSSQIAMASALFAAWMNVTGSLLAAMWRVKSNRLSEHSLDSIQALKSVVPQDASMHP